MNLLVNQIEKLLPKKKIDIFGANSLMFNTLPYYLFVIILAGTSYGGIETGYTFLLIVYGILPLLDEFFSFDQRNPTKEERKILLDHDVYFKAALYATIIIDWLLFFSLMKFFSQLEFTVFNFIKFLGFAFIYSNLQSVQFAIAHEVFHKQGVHRYLGTLHMVKNLYVHFTYEHLYGHHRKVATP